jgi:hypothetical protein
MKRLAYYLSEQEDSFLSFRQTQMSTPQGEAVILEDCVGSDYVHMLDAFATTLRQLIKREYLQVLDGAQDFVSLNYCMLGDSLCVLANCISLTEHNGNKQTTRPSTSLRYWAEACQEYRTALEGWTRVGLALNHPNVAMVCCGIARCLRELGEQDRAIQILSTVLSARKSDPLYAKDSVRAGEKRSASLFRDKSQFLPCVAFVPPAIRHSRDPLEARLTVGLEQSTALSLWSMAAYTVESSPDERGRIRALSLLHASSEALQSALKRLDGVESLEHDRTTCLEMLRVIEDEARQLYEPIQPMGNARGVVTALDSDNDSVKSGASGDIDTHRHIERRLASRRYHVESAAA